MGCKTRKMANFGEWVRRNLTEHDKSISWLADQIHCNPTMVIKWRAGVEPRTRNFLETCQAIAKMRGDSVYDVLTEAALHMGVPLVNPHDCIEHAPNKKPR